MISYVCSLYRGAKSKARHIYVLKCEIYPSILFDLVFCHLGSVTPAAFPGAGGLGLSIYRAGDLPGGFLE